MAEKKNMGEWAILVNAPEAEGAWVHLEHPVFESRNAATKWLKEKVPAGTRFQLVRIVMVGLVCEKVKTTRALEVA